jgi:hypothetical protein
MQGSMQRIALFMVLLIPVSGLAANREADRVKESGTVLKEILGMPAEESAMRFGAAVGQEIGNRCGRQLRPRRDDLPQRGEIYGRVVGSGNVRAGRREYWISIGRAGYGLPDSGDQ